MKYTRPNESKRKKQLRAVQKQVIKHSYQREVPVMCPYCHGKMIIKKIGELDPASKRADDLICVCEHYGDICTCSVKVVKGRDSRLYSHDDNRLYANGTPADANLKSLRNEGHFYLDQIISFGICSDVNEVYDMIAMKLLIQREQCHLSIFQEARCKMAIIYMLHMLNNPSRTKGRVRAYHSVSKQVRQSYTDSDKEANALFQKIKQNEKEHNEQQ